MKVKRLEANSPGEQAAASSVFLVASEDSWCVSGVHLCMAYGKSVLSPAWVHLSATHLSTEEKRKLGPTCRNSQFRRGGRVAGQTVRQGRQGL